MSKSKKFKKLRQQSGLITNQDIIYQKPGVKFTKGEASTLISILEKHRKIAIANRSPKAHVITSESWEKISNEYNQIEIPRTLEQIRGKYLTFKKQIRRQVAELELDGVANPYKHLKLKDPLLRRVKPLLMPGIVKKHHEERNKHFDSDNSIPFEGFDEDRDDQDNYNNNVDMDNHLLKIEKIEEAYNEQENSYERTTSPTGLLEPSKKLVLNPTTMEIINQPSKLNQWVDSRKDLTELQIFLMEQDYNSKEKRENEYHAERMKLIKLEQEKMNLEIYLKKMQIDKLLDK